jgi:hypothetical protein
MDSKPNSAKTNALPALHPRFAAQLDGWRPTLLERFIATLERLTAELDSGTVYHAPERVHTEAANFIGAIKHGDVIARGDVAAFDLLYNQLHNGNGTPGSGLRALKFIEQPVKKVA